MSTVETIRIPARTGWGAAVRAGDRVRVIDPEGAQVADVFAFCRDDPSEYRGAEHTRAYVSRLFPRVGEQFVTNRRRPILTLEADDSPGIHDMLCAACDPTRYEGLESEWSHASCQENLLGAMSRARRRGGRGAPADQPVHEHPGPRGRCARLASAPTGAGDSTTLRAELDCYVVVSACPQDLVPINAGSPGPIDVEITRA